MKYFAICLFFLQTITIFGQCPSCDPDLSCVSADGQPTLCPETLPVGFTGEYYEQVLTFFLPSTILEPELNVTVTLNQITITSVTGLPFGFSYTTNNPNGVYFPAQGENYGCATLCGTPLLPGIYDVLINVAVVATVAGFEVNQNQSFTYTLVIEQGSTTTSSFTIDNTASCGSLTANLEATLNGANHQITTYNWNLGNGETSTNPSVTALYETEGDYEVSLNTIISEYILDEINLGNINGSGNGDIDEFFSGTADPYFTLSDGEGNVVFTSTTTDNSTTVVWSNLNIVLSNPEYSISFWDEDDLTADDLLGTFNIDLTSGQAVFNSGDGTIGTWTILLQETLNITDEVTVSVLPSPTVTISSSTNTLTATIAGGNTFQWFLNGIPITGATDDTLIANEGGVYSCAVSNEFGCETISSDFVLCLPVNIVFDELNNELSVEDIYTSYQWTFNGLPIEGANDSFILDPASGNYGITVTTNYGCEIEGEVLTVVNSTNDLEFANSLKVFPNPSQGIYWLDLTESKSSLVNIEILNLEGRLISKIERVSTSEPIQLDLRENSSGIYVLRVTNDTYSAYLKVIKN